jgi:hypothetical protein
LQRGVEMICITRGIKKEVKVNTTTKEIKDIISATIEINKCNSCYISDETKIRT